MICFDCEQEKTLEAKNTEGEEICNVCFCENYAHCEDCSEVIPGDSPQFDDYDNQICEICAEDYTLDELTDNIIHLEHAVHAIHSGSDRVITHCNNAQQINSEWYTEKGADEHFCMCDCHDLIPMENAYFNEYGEGPYCENCLPSEEMPYYDCGKDIDPDETTYEEIPRRRFGIELELTQARECAEENEYNGEHWFECTEDGSLSGDECAEFVSPILCGDEGLNAIRDFLVCAESADTNNSCGFHLHIDTSDFSDREKHNLMKYCSQIERIARMLVPIERSTNRYCAQWLEGDFNYHRYSGFNFRSYKGTMEVRLHYGTKDENEIINWVKLWVCAVDDFLQKGLPAWKNLSDQALFNRFIRCAGKEIAEYYAEKANGYGYPITKEETYLRLDCPGQLYLQFA